MKTIKMYTIKEIEVYSKKGKEIFLIYESNWDILWESGLI